MRPKNLARPRAIAVRALLVVGIVAALVGTSESSAQVAEPLFTVSVSKATGLQNGEPVTVHLRARSDVRFTSRLGTDKTVAKICSETPAEVPLASITTDTGSCTAYGEPLSSSQLPIESKWSPALNADRTEAELDIAVGVGATAGEHGLPQVTCDPSHPCRLAVAAYVSVNGGRGQYAVDSSTVLTYAGDDPLAGCGKADPNGLTFSSSERLAEAWGAWTGDYCATPGHDAGAPTTGSFDEDGSAISQFDAGLSDLAYVGSAQKELGARPNKRRFVAVPLALDAAVMGLGGWRAGTDPDWPARKGPIDGVRLTVGETAALIGWGTQNLAFGTAQGSAPLKSAILNRNPQLDGALYVYDGDTLQGDVTYVSGSAVAETYLASRLFSARSPAQWTRATLPGSEVEGEGEPIGALGSFALLTPPLKGTVTLKGRAELDGSASKLRIGRTVPTAVWYFTNLEAAIGAGLSPADLQTSKGDFVAPTEASLQAAVPTLKADADGLLAPDPDPAGDVAGAYPLTFVEYALVPAEPLLTEDCKPRTASQAVLTSWLTYATGPGQAELPPGLIGLTPALEEQAAAAIAKVGKAATTGPCASDKTVEKPTTPSTQAPTTDPASPSGNAGDFGTDGLGSDGFGDTGSYDDTGNLGDQALGTDTAFDSGAAGSSGADSEAGSAGSATRTPSAVTRKRAAADVAQKGVTLPSFFGAAPISALVPPFSLGAVALLTSVAALGTSGRPIPAVHGLKRRLGRIRVPGRGR